MEDGVDKEEEVFAADGSKKKPTLGQSLIPVLVMVGLLASSVIFYAGQFVVWPQPDRADPLGHGGGYRWHTKWVYLERDS